jgi:Ca2+-binding EF-hand superfamily protein
MATFDPEDFLTLSECEDREETIRLCEKIFAVVDTNRNDALDKNEMIEMMTQFSGYIVKKSSGLEEMPSAAEIAKVAEEALTDMDENEDGKVTLDEFKKYALN